MSAPIERLSRDDELMLDASGRWPQDIGAIAILDGTPLHDEAERFRLDDVRDAIAGRLHLVPRLRQVVYRPSRWLGPPLWVDVPRFEIADHVRELRLEPPAGEPELLRAAESLRRERLDAARPMWEIWFLTGLPDRRVAMFVKIHHSIGDGLAAMSIVGALMDPAADAQGPPPPAWRPAQRPSEADLAADELRRRLRGLRRGLAHLAHPVATFRQVRRALPALREVFADRPGSRTSLDRIIGLDRDLAVLRAPYRGVRRIARRHGATANDVLLAVTAAGLRRMLLARGEPVDEITLRAYVPVTLRRRLGGAQVGTVVSQMVVPLPLVGAEPAARLRAIAAETKRRRARPRVDLGKLFRGRRTTRILLKIIIGQRVNVATASVPGPRRPGSLAGARVLGVFPILPLLGNQPIGVGAVSYAGTLGIGVTIDRAEAPDLATLLAGMRDELRALGSPELGELLRPAIGATPVRGGSDVDIRLP